MWVKLAILVQAETVHITIFPHSIGQVCQDSIHSKVQLPHNGRDVPRISAVWCFCSST